MASGFGRPARVAGLLALLAPPVIGRWVDDAARAEELVAEAEALAQEDTEAAQLAAAERYRQAGRLWGEAGESERGARAFETAGEILVHRGSADAAVGSLVAGVELARRAGADALELELLDNIAFAYYRAGRRDQTLSALERSLARTRELGDRAREADALGNIGSTYSTWGRTQEALDVYREALALRRQLGDDIGIGTALNNMAILYAELGEPERAIEIFEQSLVHRRRSADKKAEATTLRSLGGVLEELDDLDRAAHCYERSLELLGSEASGFGRVGSLLAMGRLARRSGDLERARTLVRSALETARELSWPTLIVPALLELAVVEADRDRRLALDLLSEAETLSRGLDETVRRVEIHRQRARILRDSGHFADALGEVETAVDLQETARARLIHAGHRASAAGASRDLYDLWIDILLRSHDKRPDRGLDRKAFEVAERARGRFIREILTSVIEPAAEPVDRGVAESSQVLEGEIAAIQRRLREEAAAGSPAADLARLEERLADLEQERERLREEEARASHDPSRIVGLEPVSASEIQELLPTGSALLLYQLGKEGSTVFVLTRDRFLSRRLAAEAELTEDVERLVADIGRPTKLSSRSRLVASRQLFQRLLGPVEPALRGSDHLLVSPDGVLHRLPYEILLTEEPETTVDRPLPYLVRQRAVTYVPSASALADLVRRRSAATGEITRAVVVADPDYESTADESEVGAVQATLVRSVFGPDGRWAPRPLQSARREALSIQKVLGPTRVDLLVGPRASESGVKQSESLSRASHLHFATHALVSERNPSLSGLVLTLEPEGAEDGVLQVPEIERLDLTADLVVLSACETALGREIRGEGLIGLSQAFLGAGAQSVIVSLWPILDESTADLMVTLYGHLAQGVGKAEALRQAKLRMADGERYAHPFYWAPFVLQGVP